MISSKFLYLAINILTISFPLIRSFEHRIHFYSKWRSLFVGIAITGSFFILWDVLFTRNGVWGFNDRYITGFRILHLPIEEWLFFITVPFACMFNYEVMNYFVKRDVLGKVAPKISLILGIVLVILGFVYLDRVYTSITFLLTGVFLVFHVWILKSRYLGRFYLGYLVSLIPFIIVNGILTGSIIEEEVVWYNNLENLHIRLGTIPIEDSMYLLLLLLMTTTIYEKMESIKR